MYEFLIFQLTRVLLVLLYAMVYFNLRLLGDLIPYSYSRLSVVFMSDVVLLVILEESLRSLYSFFLFLTPLLPYIQQDLALYISALNAAIESVVYVTIGLLGLIFSNSNRVKVDRGYVLVIALILAILITCAVSSGYNSVLLLYLKILSLLIGITLFSAFLFEYLPNFSSKDSILKASLFGDVLVLVSILLLIVVYLINIVWFPVCDYSSITSLLFAVLILGIYIDVFPPNVLVSLMGGFNVE